MRSYKLVVSFLLLVSAPYITITDNGDTKSPSEGVISSVNGVRHNVEFHKNNNSVIINTVNPTDENNRISDYNVVVDDRRVHVEEFKLDRNETHTKEISITSGINVNRDNHTVTFETYGNSTQFNFTREINSSDPDGIPRPHITNVEVTNGQVKGKSSAVAEVTLVNPSDQIYSTKLFVHTTETDGSLYPASVRPGDTRTITVELLDERGSKIAGEVRLYTGNLTTKDGAMDQVEFAGQAGSDTRTWNASYEPVRPTWMSNNYEYHNGSYARSFGEKVSGGHEVGGVPLAYVGLALVGGFGILRKLR